MCDLASEYLRLAIRLPDQPTRAEQCVAADKAGCAQEPEEAEEFEGTTRIPSALPRDRVDQAAEDEALTNGCEDGAAGKCEIPDPAEFRSLLPEAEGDAYEDEGEQHEHDRQVE